MNTFDWVSRSADASADLAGFRGKVVALLAASPGPLGGLRALAHLRSLLSNIGCTVLADQVTIRRSAEAFAPDGSLLDPAQSERVEALGATLADWIVRLQAS